MRKFPQYWSGVTGGETILTARIDSGAVARSVSPGSPGTGFQACAPDLVAHIEGTGTACLPGAVGAEWLASVGEYAARVSTGEHDVMIEGADAAALPFLHELSADSGLQELMESVARFAHPAGDRTDRTFDWALRVINGPDPQRRPLWLHYDASVVTMVIPVVVPQAAPGQSGELVLCPNRRPYRSWALTNLIEKMVVQSDSYRRRFLRRLRWDRDAEIVAVRPGDAYLFWGYRSYHATLPCAPGTSRVTVVLHYRNVHGNSRLIDRAKRVRAALRPA